MIVSHCAGVTLNTACPDVFAMDSSANSGCSSSHSGHAGVVKHRTSTHFCGGIRSFYAGSVPGKREMHEGEGEEENHGYCYEKYPMRVLMNPAERFWGGKGEEIVRAKV